MKVQRLLFIVSMSVVLFSCGGPSNNNNGDWLTRSVFSGQNRIGAVAFTVNNIGYVSTGFDGIFYYNDLWAYDPGQNSWTQIDTFPGSKRALGVAFATSNFGYVGAGWNGSGVNGTGLFYLNDFFRYDPNGNTWTQIPNMPTPNNSGRKFATAFGFGAPYNLGGVIGGYDGQYLYNDFYRYDEASNTWFADNNYPGPKRQGAVSWVYDDGHGPAAYLITGTGDNGINLSDFWRYRPGKTTGSKWDDSLRRIQGVTDQSYDAGYRIARTDAVAFQGMNGTVNKAYITFGSNGGPLIDCWEYDYPTDLWTQKDNFPPGGGRVGAVSMTLMSAGPGVGAALRPSGYVGLGGTSLSAGVGGTFYSDWTEFFPDLPYNQDDYYVQ
jgi:N-acetylneuraminic acid mutarotase